MPLAQLISPQQLAERQQSSGWVILDCRFALEDPDYGLCSYAEGHIEGAQYADLERHLGRARLTQLYGLLDELIALQEAGDEGAAHELLETAA